MKTPKIAFASLMVAAVAAAIAVAGCGSSDDPDPTTTATELTRQEFLAQANQICADGNKEVNADMKTLQQQNGGSPPSEADIESLATDILIPSTQQQIVQIRALGVPDGDEDQVDAILDSAQSDIDKLKDDPSLLTSNLFTQTNKLARGYGMTECAGS